MSSKLYITALVAGITASLASAWTLTAWIRLPLPPTDIRKVTQEGSLAEKAVRSTASNLPLETTFRKGSATPGSWPGSWPGFRGAQHNAIVADSPPLANSWPESGPPEIWRIELGDGHAGPAVENGRVYLLDYDETLHADRLLCLSLENGAEIWSRSYNVRIKRNHGISRTVPAVAEGVVVTIGPKCHLMACDAVSGEFLWGFDMVARYNTKVPLWYTGQCPLIDNGELILAPGGDTLMTALDLRSGETIWKLPNPNGWEMSHASVTPMTVDGTRTWIYPAIGGLICVAADGAERGKLLCESDAWDHSVVAPSPVPIGSNLFLCTAGYGSGSKIFSLLKTGETWQIREEQELDRRHFACEQQTPIFHNGLIYTILPKDAGDAKEEFACMTPEGERLWCSGREHRFGLGPFIAVDGKFLILRDNGELVMADANASGYNPLASARIIDGRDAWAPPAMIAGRLLMRDERTLVCLDLRAEAKGMVNE